MKSKTLVMWAASALLLPACGGGGGGSDPVSLPLPMPPAPVEKFGGFFFGEMIIDEAQGSEECAALVTEDGHFRFLCAFTDLQLAGMSSRDMNALSGTGFAYSSLGFLDGTMVSDLTVEATLVQGTSLAGTWTTAAGDAGSFDMLYDAEYDRDSSLALLTGVWQSTDDLGNPIATFDIDELGVFTATNSNGCTSSGTFLVLDNRYNLYQMDSTITGCPIEGDYSGLALVSDDLATNDAILFAIGNDQRALLVWLEKT